MGSDIVIHGGDIFDKDILYDFSSNVNPLGMPENVRKILVSSVDLWEKYPDCKCRELIKKLSVYENISPENIVCGNGADDLIFRIKYALNPKKILICEPTFSEYERAFSDSDIKKYILKEENNFNIQGDILNYINDVDMVIICSPNNPTGIIPDINIIKSIAEKCTEKNITLLFDECFLDFAENAENLSIKNYLNKNTIVLKAFTKIYAMAGLRLGYALFGDSKTAEKIKNTGQFWSVSCPAQTAGIYALDEKNYIKNTVKYIKREREYLTENLRKYNIKVFDSSVNFILLKTDIPLYKILLKDKILIRKDLSGLDDKFYRMAVRTHEENEYFINTIKKGLK